MSSLTTTERNLPLELQPIQRDSMMGKELFTMQSWSLSTTISPRFSFCIVQVVVEKHLFATPLLLQFVPKARLLFVWHHLELHHFYLMEVEQLTPHSVFHCKSMKLLLAILQGAPISILYCNKLQLLSGMKFQCNTSMLLRQ